MPTGHDAKAPGQPAGDQAGQTGHWTGPTGVQAGHTGHWAGQAATDDVVFRSAQSSGLTIPHSSGVLSFPGDFHGKQCVSGKRSRDVFNDFLDILADVSFIEDKVKWKLHHYASVSDYELWESHIHQGLQRCGIYEFLDGSTRLALVVRRVDEEIHNWWNKEMRVKGIMAATWFDFREFLRACFVFGNKPTMHVKTLK
jgi:hypothetical protein